MTRWLPLAWAAALAVLVLGPALGPGYVLIRDMVWVPDLPLRSDMLGLGSALPRAVPSDAVVAALDEVVPGMLLQKLVLLGALVGAGTGCAALVGGGLVARLVAVSVGVWNPFVVERLAIGHWPVLLGYAAVPWLAVAGRRIATGGRIPAWAPLVLVAGSLSASAGLVSAAVLLVTALAGGVRRRSTLPLALMVVAANAPWVAAGLTHAGLATSAAGFRPFATASDGLPAPLAVLTFGGIWNADVVPTSREGALAWIGLLAMLCLAACGARRWWRSEPPGQQIALLVLWGVGVGLALLSWASPDAMADASAHVPGLALLRDGSRSLALALPLTVGVVATGAARLVDVARQSVGRWSLAVAVVLLPIAVLPDVAWGIGGALQPAHYPDEWLAARTTVRAGEGDAIILPWSAYRAPAWNGHRPVIDPLARLVPADVVTNQDLVVGSMTVAGEDPRARRVSTALAAPTPSGRADALRALGVRWVLVEKDAGEAPSVHGRVVHDGPLLRIIRLDGNVPLASPSTARSIATAAAWAAFVGLVLVDLAGVVRTARVRMTTSGLPAGSVRD
ncbi:hypothetical protein [Nocardioides sp. CER19]|uniref:hypothetical protein n=1 Tax=Nocardioides sp. CER19 TaxID=3038538 RepID=UPI0024475880|nr:hypothetical protein [Nocardioides sp. CER19]MDH2416640.1 hypothetical protein [Nocardioides sp. CER19]